MADMESMTDDQMGTVQGLSGTIVSSHPVLPRPALSADSPRVDDSNGRIAGETAKQVFSSSTLDKNIHPGSGNQDVLFSIHVDVDSMTYRSNDTRMVEAWSGNRVDFQSVYLNTGH
jgi:hypothetical protein